MKVSNQLNICISVLMSKRALAYTNTNGKDENIAKFTDKHKQWQKTVEFIQV